MCLLLGGVECFWVFWGFLSVNPPVSPVDVNQGSGITGPEVFILFTMLFLYFLYDDCGVLKDCVKYVHIYSWSYV